MKKIAMIKNGVVENVSAWDIATPWNPGPEYTLVDCTDYDVQIGDTYNANDLSFHRAAKEVAAVDPTDIVEPI